MQSEMEPPFKLLVNIVVSLAPFQHNEQVLREELTDWCTRLLHLMNPARSVVSCSVSIFGAAVCVKCDFGSGCGIDVVVVEGAFVTFSHQMPVIDQTKTVPHLIFELDPWSTHLNILRDNWLRDYLEITKPYLA